MIKDTSLLSTIGGIDITRAGDIMIANTGNAVYYNGGTYWIKQVIANGGWQQLKIYVSEIKAMLAGVPESNETEFDTNLNSLFANTN